MVKALWAKDRTVEGRLGAMAGCREVRPADREMDVEWCGNPGLANVVRSGLQRVEAARENGRESMKGQLFKMMERTCINRWCRTNSLSLSLSISCSCGAGAGAGDEWSAVVKQGGQGGVDCAVLVSVA